MVRSSKQTLVRQAYDHIHAQVASGKIVPGDMLSEAALAEQLGMSRTPVGEAFRLLVGEGLLEQIPRYGTMVRAIDRTDLVELYELREALEPFAAAMAAERILPPLLQQLGQLCNQVQAIVAAQRALGKSSLDEAALQQFLGLDMTFHLSILQAAGNKRMLKIVEETRSIARIFQTPRVEHTLELVLRADAFHRAILAALTNRDGATARQQMAEHLAVSKQQALVRFEQQQLELAQRISLDVPN